MTKPLFDLITDANRAAQAAADAARHADLDGAYAWRWVDSDEWEPVDGTHASAAAARAALGALGIDVAEIVVEAVDW